MHILARVIFAHLANTGFAWAKFVYLLNIQFLSVILDKIS